MWAGRREDALEAIAPASEAVPHGVYRFVSLPLHARCPCFRGSLKASVSVSGDHVTFSSQT